MTARTGAERYFAEQMEDPEYRACYRVARLRIELEDHRRNQGMSKAELARRAGLPPQTVRRLLSSTFHPTLQTLVAMCDALGLELRIEKR